MMDVSTTSCLPQQHPSTSEGKDTTVTPDLREHEVLSEILSQIPQKVQRGLKTQYEMLELTSVDVDSDYIALGSSVGIVFLYNREKHKIERLRSECSIDSVSCVKLHHGLHHQVAVGYRSGALYIFQLPNIMIGHSKQLERFVVSDLHTSGLSCLTWSTNGMKLYSGDTEGGVGCTEVDFEKHECKSSMLLIEYQTEIVQLDQSQRSLLVSTRHRCAVCRMDESCRMVQIGQKDRKILGNFGACFIPALCKPDEAQLYAARPGFRIWRASVGGAVSNTYMFKEILSKDTYQIPVMPCKLTSITKTSGQLQFGPLMLFNERWLVTWNEAFLYVLNCDSMSVVGTQKIVGGIKSVAVADDEIFLLRENTDRNLIRLALKPLESVAIKLLKQLALEREQIEEEAEGKTANSIKDPASSSKGDKSSENSPKLFFKKNILDKVKKISSPVTEIIQEKLKSDSRSGDDSKRYGQEYVFQQEQDEVGKEAYESSPDLPPIVELASPDLLRVTLTTSLEILSLESNDEIMTDTFSRSTELRSHLIGSHIADDEQGAKLQENSEISRVSFPIERIEKFSSTAGEEDSIVFNPKTSKVKKKKKVGKVRPSHSRDSDVMKTVDLDALSVSSVTSATSATSDSSENITHLKDGQWPNTSREQAVDNIPVDNVSTPASDQPGQESSPKIQDHSTVNDTVNADCISSFTEKFDDIKSESEQSTYGESEVNGRGSIRGSLEKDDAGLYDSPIRPSVIEFGTGGSSSDISPVYQSEKTKPQEVENPSPVSNLYRETEQLNSCLSQESQEAEAMSSSQQESIPDISLQLDSLMNENQRERTDYFPPRNIDKIYSCELQEEEKYTETDLDRQINALDMAAISTEPADEKKEKSNKKSPSVYSIYRTPASSTDDFYSQYTTAQSSSTVSSASSDPLTSSDKAADDSTDDESPSVSTLSIHVTDSAPAVSPPKSVNIWTEFATQANIYSLSVTHTHIWFTDKSNNIYYSSLAGQGVTFKKAAGSARQIAVSRLGNIVWCLQRNTVFAGTKITAKHPEGMKWVEAVKDVNYIAVDETCAWYIKTLGEVKMQKGLSRDRPCYTPTDVDCPWRLKQIVCQSGVVWALTDDCQWVIRRGITQACPEGTDWEKGASGAENKLFSAVALGDGNLGWAIDVIGHVWFCCGVTMATPKGDNRWWQVSFSSEYLMKDMTAFDMLKSLTKKLDPQKLSQLLSTQRSGLISAGQGVWVCPEFKHVLHVCRGSLEGHYWGEAHPGSLTSSSSWKLVVAANADIDGGLIWAQQPNGDLFTFTPDRQTCRGIGTPQPGLLFVCISICASALWGLTDNGDVYIRTGMGSAYPQGIEWVKLDLSQLDESHLVYVSCGNVNVWAVDSDGNIFHRIGVKAPSDHSLNAAWLPVDNGGTVFTQILTGPQDWMVWAVDNRRQVYVRTGITQEMPIGRNWAHVSGTPAMKLTISAKHVWALNPAGELLCRYGITKTNVTGDYWKKMPGAFTHVSASPSDGLWGINRDGQLIRREAKYIIKKDPHETLLEEVSQRASSVGSDDGEWELV